MEEFDQLSETNFYIEVWCEEHKRPVLVGMFVAANTETGWSAVVREAHSQRTGLDSFGYVEDQRITPTADDREHLQSFLPTKGDQPSESEALKSRIAAGESIASFRRRYDLKCPRCLGGSGNVRMREENVKAILDRARAAGVSRLPLRLFESYGGSS